MSLATVTVASLPINTRNPHRARPLTIDTVQDGVTATRVGNIEDLADALINQHFGGPEVTGVTAEIGGTWTPVSWTVYGQRVGAGARRQGRKVTVVLPDGGEVFAHYQVSIDI